MARGSELYTVGALEGMGKLGPNEDECVSIPDLDTLTVLPWDPKYALAATDLWFHGQPYSHDPRRVLRRQVEEAAAMGFRPNLGVEPEVYVLRQVDGDWRPFVASDLDNLPTRGYDLEATILAEPFLDPMVTYMNQLGWDVFSFDHEGGDGQYEFDFGYTDVLSMADRMIVFRLMAKHVARTLGCIATFMPKPRSRAPGREPTRPTGGPTAASPSWPTSSPPASSSTPGRSPRWSARRSTPTSGCCPAG
jgi:glutamine synthetase